MRAGFAQRARWQALRIRHWRILRANESQGTYPSWSNLTLSARESVARGLALFARLFYCTGQFFDGDQYTSTVFCHHAHVGLWCVCVQHTRCPRRRNAVTTEYDDAYRSRGTNSAEQARRETGDG